MPSTEKIISGEVTLRAGGVDISFVLRNGRVQETSRIPNSFIPNDKYWSAVRQARARLEDRKRNLGTQRSQTSLPLH